MRLRPHPGTVLLPLADAQHDVLCGGTLHSTLELAVGAHHWGYKTQASTHSHRTLGPEGPSAVMGDGEGALPQPAAKATVHLAAETVGKDARGPRRCGEGTGCGQRVSFPAAGSQRSRLIRLLETGDLL